jgi:hypothetical protein
MAYDRNPLLTTFADKVAVRDYVAEKVGPEILSHKLGVFSTLESVRREDLPRNFVLKANHGSGASIICWEQAPRGTVLHVPTDSRPTWERFLIHPDDLDWDAVVRLSSRWMRQNYYWRLGKFPEWAYKNIAPQLLVEEVLIHNGGLPEDYRFYMVGGVCKLIQVDGSRFTEHERELYTPDWKRISEETGQVVEIEGRAPRLLGQMLEIAAALSTEVDFVRVDLYQTDKGVVFGELSNYPEGGSGLTYLPDFPTEWAPTLTTRTA